MLSISAAYSLKPYLQFVMYSLKGISSTEYFLLEIKPLKPVKQITVNFLKT